MFRNLVFYAKTDQRKKFTLEILKIFDNQLKGKVLIKPNQVSFEEYPTTTHIETLEMVLQFLKDRGLDIIVGDGYAVDVPPKKMRDTPIQKVCDIFKVPFLDFHKEKMEERKTVRGFVINMSTVPFNDFDCIISLPILKVHEFCMMTGALKNIVGYFNNTERLVMHSGKKNIHEMIAEANWLLLKRSGLKLYLTIMDAVKTLIKTNEIRHGGQIVDLGYMLAGTNPVSLDIFGFNLLKKFTSAYPDKDFMDIKHIYYSIKYGLGTKDYELRECCRN